MPVNSNNNNNGSGSADERRRAVLAASASVPPHVVYRPFASETVVLNLETGLYHGLNPTGGRMLEELERADSVRSAAAALATEFGVPVADLERDLADFCLGLADRGLVELQPAP
jgi:hypothetical protein